MGKNHGRCLTRKEFFLYRISKYSPDLRLMLGSLAPNIKTIKGGKTTAVDPIHHTLLKK
jgi:hypothetical protein